jgi:hypothetical protein
MLLNEMSMEPVGYVQNAFILDQLICGAGGAQKKLQLHKLDLGMNFKKTYLRTMKGFLPMCRVTGINLTVCQKCMEGVFVRLPEHGKSSSFEAIDGNENK